MAESSKTLQKKAERLFAIYDQTQDESDWDRACKAQDRADSAYRKEEFANDLRNERGHTQHRAHLYQ